MIVSMQFTERTENKIAIGISIMVLLTMGINIFG
jgi:hypothetical protein